jgi:hypothetical protein
MTAKGVTMRTRISLIASLFTLVLVAVTVPLAAASSTDDNRLVIRLRPTFDSSTRAAGASTSCRTSGHSATSAEIVARSETTLAKVRGDMSWLRAQFDQATIASPAAWRLHEELDRLAEQAKVLDQLHYVAFIRSDATPGSPAQFRAQEELDSLCD